MFSWLRLKRSSDSEKKAAKPPVRRVFSAVRHIGTNVKNNINFAAEHHERKAAPAGYKFEKSFTDIKKAGEAKYKFEARGYATKVVGAKNGYGKPIAILYIKEKSSSTRKVEKQKALKGFRQREVYNGTLWKRAAMAKAKEYADSGYEVKIGHRQGKIIIYTKKLKQTKKVSRKTTHRKKN
ncbi:MAG: hypothetical protein LLF94_08830 [Chlamydiales bacterium]|nr:hypothetical protein [Chlamydiales bacterium]